jgi:hypothetical protein
MELYYKIHNGSGYTRQEWLELQADPRLEIFLGTKLIDKTQEIKIEVTK